MPSPPFPCRYPKTAPGRGSQGGAQTPPESRGGGGPLPAPPVRGGAGRCGAGPAAAARLRQRGEGPPMPETELGLVAVRSAAQRTLG